MDRHQSLAYHLHGARIRHTILKAVRAFVFPATCIGCGQADTGLCIDCAPAVAERDCVLLDSAELVVATLGLYRCALREAVLALKDGRRDIADAIIELIAYRLGCLLPATVREASKADRLCLVGIPTTQRRRRERGFDGGLFLAEGLGLLWGIPVLPLLEQTRGDSQRGRTRRDRLQAIGRFRMTHPAWLGKQSIVLVDDVLTTGATLTDATRVLREEGAEVLGAIAIARVVIEDG